MRLRGRRLECKISDHKKAIKNKGIVSDFSKYSSENDHDLHPDNFKLLDACIKGHKLNLFEYLEIKKAISNKTSVQIDLKFFPLLSILDNNIT